VGEVDWPCTVKTLFQHDNLGPMRAQIAALDWFFKEEEQGIVLEDDCLPVTSFFSFCDELLERYKNDRRIFMISGDNFQNGRRRSDGDYYFSVYTHIWGWAAWRRTWECFDESLTAWPDFKQIGGIESLHRAKKVRRYWKRLFDSIYSGEYGRGWDYRLLFACWREGGLVVLPQKNMVKNIGFGRNATNCLDADSDVACLPAEEINTPLRHPSVIARSVYADEYTSKRMFSERTFLERVSLHARNPGNALKKLLGIMRSLRFKGGVSVG